MSDDLRARYDALMRRPIHGDEHGISLDDYHQSNREMFALLNDALAENERLRAALQSIADGLPWDIVPGLTSSLAAEYRRAAQAALATSKDG